MEKIKKLEKYIILYDKYKNLLTVKQQEIFELYYFKDYSLSEIAEFKGITRSAVYDFIKTAERQLLNYDRKLHLV